MTNYLTPGSSNKGAMVVGTPMNIGNVEGSPGGVEVMMRDLVRQRQREVEIALTHLGNGSAASHYRRLNYPLGLADYLEALRRLGNLERRSRRGDFDEDTGESDGVLGLRDLAMRLGRDAFSADVGGWLNYLAEIDIRFMKAVEAMPAPDLPEETRRENTLIVAARGRGKSELMKALVHHYVTNPKAAFVVIDPHGDMARQVAHWPEFSGSHRLAYIEPRLIQGHSPRLNPFALGHSLAPDLRATYSQQLARTLTELVPEAELTPNMLMLTTNCVRVLIERGGTSLHDLYAMLGDRGSPVRDSLVRYAKSHSNRTLSLFFSEQFDGESLRPSKAGLRNRLMMLLTSDGFCDLVCADGCLDVEDAISKRKALVFNLSTLGADEAVAVGRLVLMMLWSIGQRRIQDKQRPRDPVHVFVDEATKFAGKAVGEILSELRKAGVHLTLAQQVGGDGFSKEVRERVYSGTAIKFAGANDSGEMAKVLRQKPEMLGKLKDRQFWCRWGEGSDLVKITVRGDLADDSHSMTDSEWSSMVRSWRGTVYRPVIPPAPVKPAENDLPFD